MDKATEPQDLLSDLATVMQRPSFAGWAWSGTEQPRLPSEDVAPQPSWSAGTAPAAEVTDKSPLQEAKQAPRQAARGVTLQELRRELKASFRELGLEPPRVAAELQSEIQKACNASTELLRHDLRRYINELGTELQRHREELAEQVTSKFAFGSGSFVNGEGSVSSRRSGYNAGKKVRQISRQDSLDFVRMTSASSRHSLAPPPRVESACNIVSPEGVGELGERQHLVSKSSSRVGPSTFSTPRVSRRSSRNRLPSIEPVHFEGDETRKRHPTTEAEEALLPQNASPCRYALSRFVNSPGFGNTISVVVLLYTAMIGVETDYMARHWDEPEPTFFWAIGAGFCGVFVLEILLRLFTVGIRFFVGSSWRSNVFDLCLVIIQCVEVGFTARTKVEPSLVRCLKLVRSLRLIRVLHLVGELRTLTISIMNSVRSLLWSMLLLLLMTFMFGVTLTDIVTNTKRMGSMEEQYDELTNLYGSLPSTMLLLYEAISEGVHWGDVVTPLVEHCSPLLALVFCFYMSFMLFAMLNVLTAFFVESTLRVAEEDKKRHMMSELWEAFRPTQGFDDDGAECQHITIEEFQRHLDNPKMKAFLNALDLDPQTAMESPFFHLIDTDGSGEVDPEELVSGCLRLTGSAKSFDVLSLAHDYRMDAQIIKDSCRRTEFALINLQTMVSQVLEQHQEVQR